MSKKVIAKECRYCGNPIVKTRVPMLIGGRVWRWAIDSTGYYCPKAGGECWHQPKD